MNVIRKWSEEKHTYLFTPVFCKPLQDLTVAEMIIIIEHLERAIQ